MGRIQEKCAGCVGKTVDIISLNCYNEINSWDHRKLQEAWTGISGCEY